MAYKYFYPGTYSSLDPESGELFTGYRIPASEIGAPTSIQTANQIQEVANLLNQGGKTIELQPISEGVFDQIPKQHFKEINRLLKLTGAETTVHAPMIDPAGFSREGWSEENREEAERQLRSVIERSHELNSKGNIPVTIHASGIPGTEYGPGKDGKPEIQRMVVINQESKQLTGIGREARVYPEDVVGKKPEEVVPELRKPEEELELINKGEWDKELRQVYFYKERGDETLGKYYGLVKHIWNDFARGKIDIKDLPPIQQEAISRVMGSYEYIRSSLMNVNSLFDRAYKYGSPEEKKFLSEAAEKYTKKIHTGDLAIQSQAIGDMLFKMQNVKPNVYVPIEEFAKEKAASTLGKVAFDAYDKFKETAPIVSIENLYPGMAFSRSEDLKDMVEAARKKFVEEAMKKGINESSAKETAKKQIGVTWDVGHLNMLRKAGFSEEEIIKESEKIAPLVKHAHITDNFGFSDSHLPPGMGNVPIKEILEKLEKAGFSGKKIMEAGGFVQHFKVPPTKYILEAFGSPVYSVPQAPYWNQIRTGIGEYTSGPFAVMPEQHFSIYGGGFLSLPIELGGQIPGKQSRMSGTPME